MLASLEAQSAGSASGDTTVRAMRPHVRVAGALTSCMGARSREIASGSCEAPPRLTVTLPTRIVPSSAGEPP